MYQIYKCPTDYFLRWTKVFITAAGSSVQLFPLPLRKREFATLTILQDCKVILYESSCKWAEQIAMCYHLNFAQWQIQLSMLSAVVRTEVLYFNRKAYKMVVVILLIRVYAIWSNKKIVLAILLAAYIVGRSFL